MNWSEQVSLLDFLIRGVLIGVFVSAPLGPVGVLCIQRTLNKGRAYGFFTGLGASVSDMVYAAITGYFMSHIIGFINDNLYVLQLVGSALLCFFGIYTYRSNPVRTIANDKTKGSLVAHFVGALFLALSNPLIIFIFIACFARFSFVLPEIPLYEQTLGFVAIFGGTILWWFSLTYFVNKVSAHFKMRGIWILNRIIGILVAIVAVFGFIYTLAGNSFHY